MPNTALATARPSSFPTLPLRNPPKVERQLSSAGKETHLKWKENFPPNGKPSDYHMLCLGNDSESENAPVV